MRSNHVEVYGIHEAFAETSFGQTLAAEVRYDKYRPAHVSKEAWVDLLGADVNNLTHMPLTYGIARAFVNHARRHQPGLMDEREERLLLVAAISHDWGESITTDISFGDKTAQHDAEERAVFEENMGLFYSGSAVDIVDEARRTVIFDHNTKIGKIFNAVERIGYLRTALRAHDHLEAGVQDPELRNGLEWLVFDVLSNTQPKDDLEAEPTLLRLSHEYAPVRAYLEAVGHRVLSAFSMAAGNMFAITPNYGDDARQKQEQMVRSVWNWHRYHWVTLPEVNTTTQP